MALRSLLGENDRLLAKMIVTLGRAFGIGVRGLSKFGAVAAGGTLVPNQDLASEIRVELAADALYDFDKGEVRSSAVDYFQQAANLIFDEAKGPVRVECSSDRVPTAVGQKLAARCADAIAQWLIG
jgi:hypothetical protein